MDLDKMEAVARAAKQEDWRAIRHPQHDHEKNGELWLIAAGEEDDDGDPIIAQVHEYAAPETAKHIATFDPPTVLALIARVRELEGERDEAMKALKVADEQHAKVEKLLEPYVRWEGAPMSKYEAAGARLAEAERVIEPFVWVADHDKTMWRQDDAAVLEIKMVHPENIAGSCTLSLRDFRAARAFLNKESPNG